MIDCAVGGGGTAQSVGRVIIYLHELWTKSLLIINFKSSVGIENIKI